MSEPEFIYDIEQGTPEWRELRRGIPTASEFAPILVNGDGRKTYAYRLAGEILCGAPAEQTWTRPWIERGKEMEAEVRDKFGRDNLVELRRVGFVRRKLRSGRYVGCSPDSIFESVVGPAVLEIKTMQPEKMTRLRDSGKYDPKVLPTEHHAQCMGALWVTGFKRVELLIWYRGLRFDLHYIADRHEPTIERMAAEVSKFDEEVHSIVQRAEEWGK